MLRYRMALALALVVSFALVVPATAGTLFTYPSLPAGSQFRIVFVTSVTTLSTSTNIADYNTVANNAANAAGSELQFLGATWVAIASTINTSAATNVGSSALPIYALDGTLIANGTTGLFSGSILAGITLDEKGNTVAVNQQVYTGAGTDGSIDVFGHALGNAFNQDETGVAGSTNGTWIQFTQQNGAGLPLPIYGLSGTLTVPAAALPEPGTLSLAMVAGLGLIAAARSVARRGRS